MTATVTAPMRKKAAALVDVLATCSTGTSKKTGQRFYVVPASNRMTAHWTALDGSGCTCIGYQRRGTCTHAIAAQTLHQRQQEQAAELERVLGPAPTTRYEALYPSCRSGCGDVAESRDGYCDRCASDREWQARRDAFAAIPPFTLNELVDA